MKRVLILIVAVLISACQQKTEPAKTATAPAVREKNTAEKAFDAGQNAKKNAEKIKAEQEKKAKEAIDDTNQ